MVEVKDMEDYEHLEVWLWGGHRCAMATAVLVEDGEKGIGRPIGRVMVTTNDGTATLNLGKLPKSRRRKLRGRSVRSESVILLEDMGKARKLREPKDVKEEKAH